MAKRPKNYKYVPASNMLPSPLFTTAKAIANALQRRKEKKYNKSLKKMGMFDEAGGRANVPPKGQKYKPKQKPKSDTEKLMDESRKKYRPKPKTLPGGPPRDYNPPKKRTGAKKMKPLKVAQGGRIDGIAIRGKTKGTIR
jgi:hypothetical protein|tara:strand:+ start:65 stop:484 length:420 start_codon:yes stop_codon:yes gene_type:complete